MVKVTSPEPNDDSEFVTKARSVCPEEPLVPSYAHGSFGYYPLRLGDILESEIGKYEVVRKLGWGSKSNVWLVKDVEYVYATIY
jgi:hypothetical protein